MRMRVFGVPCVLLCCALMLAPLCANRAMAQSKSDEKAAVYTYVSEWAVPRAMWADYQKSEAEDTEMLKKGVVDGTLVAFGSYAVLNHQEGNPTHGTWFSATSMGNLFKFLETLRTSPGATGGPYAASKHWDYVLESRDYSFHSGSFTNGYLRVANWKPKAGANDPDSKILRATMVALCEKLMSAGALHGYQIDREAVHSADPGVVFVALIFNGADGLDKFHSILEQAEKENPAGWAGYGSTIDPAGHRDILAKVDSMTHK